MATLKIAMALWEPTSIIADLLVDFTSPKASAPDGPDAKARSLLTLCGRFAPPRL